MGHVDVMRRYPRAKRNLDDRAARITEEHRLIARQFGEAFFDGDRPYGYGGYGYDGRWKPVVEDFRDHYQLAPDAAILDVGAAKGFMMRDFIELMPGANVQGIDISDYAVANADEVAKPHLRVASADALPFDDNSFDLVISINTAHNLQLEGCKQALAEMQRVTRSHAYVVLDAWSTPEEKERIYKWNLTGVTILSVADWIDLFAEVGYLGDYDWFMP
jgi:ubiquinone/menaquinone biosynthesis C-methylase UbiE